MNKEQLQKGNKIDQEIERIKRSIGDVKSVIKRIDIDDVEFQPDFTVLSIDGVKCAVNRERVASFLWNEKKVLEEKKEQLEEEFEGI